MSSRLPLRALNPSPQPLAPSPLPQPQTESQPLTGQLPKASAPSPSPSPSSNPDPDPDPNPNPNPSPILRQAATERLAAAEAALGGLRSELSAMLEKLVTTEAAKRAVEEARQNLEAQYDEVRRLWTLTFTLTLAPTTTPTPTPKL